MKRTVLTPKLTTQTSLNRLSEKRANRDYIKSAFESPRAKFLILADLKAPIVPGEDRSSAKLRWANAHEIEPAVLTVADPVFLGEDAANHPVFAINLSLSQCVSNEALLDRMKPHVDLRSLAIQAVLPEDELLMVAQARGILSWHAAYRCCGRCGAQTQSGDGGWRRRCTACYQDAYPRTDPAVIMLITHNDQCLLGHEHRFPDKLYSTLAGYVEAGDDIEHAVRREVKEEAGIDVGAVHYVASQPWPFPHSLMIGCWGEAMSNAITIDKTELADARWFTRDEVAAMMEFRHGEHFVLPPPISRAHVLLRGYLDGLIGPR